MEIMIFCGIYLVELICYLTVLRMLFDVQVRLRVWMTVGILMPVVVSGLSVSVSGKNFFVSISAIIVIFLTSGGKIIEKGVRLMLALLFLACVDGIFVFFCSKFLSFINDDYKRNIDYFAIKCCTVVCLLLMNLVKEKMKNYKKMHISSAIYLIIGLVVASMMFCLAFLNQAVIHLHNSRYVIFGNILNVVILMNVLLLIISVIYIKSTHEKMEQMLKTEQLLKESQVNYYKQVLKKETDTRQYRHDMMNHLIYIHDALSRYKIEEGQRYLENLLGDFKKIQNTYYVTGNEMVDAIMNYFFGMLPKGFKIQINRCPVEIDMEETEICTIFSNLFQNAVEEIMENNMKDAFIKVHVQKGKQYVEYDVVNSLSKNIDVSDIDKNGLPKSHKSDKHNHGIGMVNVKKAIERHNGKFVWYQNGNFFGVHVILPIK